MIAFKTLRALDEWAAIHPKLREMFLDLAIIWPSDRDVIVTRIAEPDPNQRTAIHTDGPPHRALDLSIRYVPMGTAERVVAAIQKEWEYDPARPGRFSPCYIHDAGSGSHIHMQVHRNTVRRMA